MESNYYRVIIICGHVGCGKSIEITRYFIASNTTECYISALSMPRSKKCSDSVKLIQQVNFIEYIDGKQQEAVNLYLRKTKKSKFKKIAA